MLILQFKKFKNLKLQILKTSNYFTLLK